LDIGIVAGVKSVNLPKTFEYLSVYFQHCTAWHDILLHGHPAHNTAAQNKIRPLHDCLSASPGHDMAFYRSLPTRFPGPIN